MHETPCTETTRLSRIEHKIDQLSDTLIAVARVEERVHSLEQTSNQLSKKIESLSLDIDSMKSRLHTNSDMLKSLSKFFWLVLGISLTTVATVIATVATNKINP